MVVPVSFLAQPAQFRPLSPSSSGNSGSQKHRCETHGQVLLLPLAHAHDDRKVQTQRLACGDHDLAGEPRMLLERGAAIPMRPPAAYTASIAPFQPVSAASPWKNGRLGSLREAGRLTTLPFERIGPTWPCARRRLGTCASSMRCRPRGRARCCGGCSRTLPGAGKTTMAKALAAMPGSPKVHLHADDFWHFIKQGAISLFLESTHGLHLTARCQPCQLHEELQLEHMAFASMASRVGKNSRQTFWREINRPAIAHDAIQRLRAPHPASIAASPIISGPKPAPFNGGK